MAKKDIQNNKKSELINDDEKVVERVREMMEPDAKKPDAKTTVDSVPPSTAPEISELPVPKEPLKIRIIRDDEPTAETEVASAPELVTEQPASTDTPDYPDPGPEESPTDTVEPDSGSSVQDTHTDISATIDEQEPAEDLATAEAVEDIVRNESDELLKAEDEKLAEAFKPQPRQTILQKLKAAIVDIWKNPKKRRVLVASLFTAILIIGIVPASRYFVLNTAGVRASANIKVLDESTFQPLKNVEVTVNGSSAKTDDNGLAKVEDIKLGTTQLRIERRAFAVVERKVTIGWGSNPLGEEKLHPTGTQYAFLVTDYLSAKGIEKAEATSDDASAFSDKDGKILLTMENPSDEIEIQIASKGKRTEKFMMSADTKAERKVRMVPDRKHAYISRRDGRFDVYAVYADGKEDSLILKGTGHERDDMVLVPHPTEEVVALVSTRDGKHNVDGYLLSGLMIIDLRTKASESVQTSERIQLTGWFGDRLAYIRVESGASASNPKRNRLMSYNYKDDTNNELAASNYFNDVMAVGDRIYYAPSGAYQRGVNVSLFSVTADGRDRKIILDKEVWNMFRTDYDHIALSTPRQWYDYRVGEEHPTKLDGEPARLSSRVYTDSPNKENSLWVEIRDGKGTLIIHDAKNNKDKTLRTESGLKNPIRWLDNNTLVYRIKTDTETADYVLSLDGGDPKKIVDVTNTDGIDRWYYY